MLKLINDHSINFKWNLLAGLGTTACLFAIIPLTQLQSTEPLPGTDNPHKPITMQPPQDVPDYEEPEPEEKPPEDEPDLQPEVCKIPLETIIKMIDGTGTGGYTENVRFSTSGWEVEMPIFDRKDVSDPPKPMIQVEPQYPNEYRHSGVDGWAIIEFIVTDKGNVIRPRVYQSSHRAFGEEAIKAVRKWRFTAGKIDGDPVMVRVHQRLNFTLN